MKIRTTHRTAIVALVTLITLLALPAYAQNNGAEDYHTWTDINGKQLKAKLIGYDGQNVQIKWADTGETFVVPLGNFSEADKIWVYSVSATSPLPITAQNSLPKRGPNKANQETGKVYLKNGQIFQGKIVSRGADGNLLIETSAGNTVTVDTKEIARLETFSVPSRKGSVGVGFGIPYGLLGVNAEVAIAPVFHLTGGIGTTVLAGPGYNVGFRFYPRGGAQKWCPRVSAFYGVNSILDVLSYYDEDTTETFQGVTIGMGQRVFLGETHRHGLDFDLLIIATRGEFDNRVDELEQGGGDLQGGNSRVKVSLGYRLFF